MTAFRVRLVAALLALGFLVVFGRLFQLQVVQGEAYEREASARVRRIELIEAPRGRILDRRGRVLAEDAESYECWVDAAKAKALLEDRQGADRLGRVLAQGGFPQAMMSLAEIAASWDRVHVGEHHRWLSGLSQPAVYWLACRHDEYPGLSVERHASRRYPQGTIAAHLLGTLSRMDRKELDKLKADGLDLGMLIARRGRAEVLLDDSLREFGRFEDELVGGSGIERMAEDRLRGRRGVRVVAVDLAKGGAREESQIEPARPGEDLRLTLDLDLQKAAEAALDRENARGAVVALDPESGAVLAMASHPTYDPNLLAAQYAALQRAPGNPLLNRALRGTYPPGSIFKLVTATAMLEDAHLDPGNIFHCDGALFEGPTRYGCDGVHGDSDLARALEVSCNVYFYHAARKIGGRVLSTRAKLFGFGSPTGLSLSGQELGGLLPEGDALNMGVGQGRLLVTPLQAARMVAAFANGGWLVRPVLLPGDRQPLGVSCVAPTSLAPIREGMWRVVLSGTARHAGLAPLHVLGKTGTAQVGGSAGPHAWFVGYGPEASPTLAVAVIVEHGGAGGEVAAPIAAEVFRTFAALPPLEPDSGV